MDRFADSPMVRAYIDANRCSQVHAERARRQIPAGASRSLLKHVPFPFYITRSGGIYATDIDGNCRIDFNNNYSSLVHGHAHPQVLAAVRDQLDQGSAYSAPGSLEAELAALLTGRVGSVDHVIFVNSGTEAVMAALRAARAYTGRNRIAKFEGGYHGWSDFVALGGHHLPAPDDDRLIGRAQADGAGLPAAATEDVILVRYNSSAAVDALIERHGAELAAVIVEPMLGSGGMIPGQPEFLAKLRAATRDAGIVLICDEVVTLRLSPGGAQALYRLEPDLTTMAKIIGGGFPIGALGGHRDIMRTYAEPEQGGRIASMGTFNANPISIRAGLAAMHLLDDAAIAHINDLGERIRRGLAALIECHRAPAQVSGLGSLFQLHWTRAPLDDARASQQADRQLALLTFIGLANRGVQLSMRCSGSVSTPMAAADIDRLLGAFDEVLGELKREGRYR